MWKRLSPLLLIAVASCSAGNGANKQANGAATVENATLTRLELTSDGFQNGQSIPRNYTCDGAGQAPPLKWGEPPPGTKSFALVVDDPDAPSGTFRHWGIYDIPASARSIAAGHRIGTEVDNDFGKPGYGAPCPPKAHGAHHYRFKLFALSVDKLDVPRAAKIVDIENTASRQAIAQGELVGIYERK